MKRLVTGLDTETYARDLTSGDHDTVSNAFENLARHLTALRDALSPAEWEAAILGFRNSALLPIFLEDPLTRRCFFRQGGLPRDGAADDQSCAGSEMTSELLAASATGQRLHALLRGRPFLQASRFLGKRTAEFMQEVVRQKPHPRILAVAAGHLHEINADLARLVSSGLVALDDDRQALDCLARRLPDAVCLHDRLPALLEGLLDDQVFDASISPGLFNMLPDALAARFLARHMRLLRDGGRVMIANFVRDAVDRGYIETFLDWKYIYRDETDMARLVSQSGASCFSKVYREPSGQMVFLELTKIGDSQGKG